jgi:hypothetical protein
MSETTSDRIEVTLGPDAGKKTFADFDEARDWLNKEREFWNLFGGERGQSNEAAAVWAPFDLCFRQLDATLTQVAATERDALGMRERASTPNYNQTDRDTLLQRAAEMERRSRGQLAGTFEQHYQQKGVIASASPRAKFLARLAKERGPRTALFACGYLMRTSTNYTNPERLEGAFAATYFEQGLTSRVPAEVEALTQLRREWQAQFQRIHDDIANGAKVQSELNTEAAAQQLKQQSEFADLLSKEKADWTALHKTYDEQLALAKPVRYWQKKAKTHRWLAGLFALVSLIVGGCVFGLLYELVQITLRVPPGLKDPAAWHPEYWRIGVLLASGVFAVWVVRIVVRLFLSHVHLLADANERVTMANTYLSLHRSRQGLQDNDRQLILQALFRPSSTGVVKDDGVPLSWIEAITKTGH